MSSLQGRHAMVATSMATFASRIGGLLRDMIVFMLLGLSPWCGAFLFAFTVPNLFRRLLGEGALTSAMLPIYGEEICHGREESAHDLFNGIISRLLVNVGGLVLIFVTFTAFLWPFLQLRWQRALGLTAILSPYLLCACIAAMLSGALNARNSFICPALTPLLLNICISLGGIFGIFFLFSNQCACAIVLCVGILVGGLMQIFLPWWMLHRCCGWKFHFQWQCGKPMERLKALFWPALLGSAVVQINSTLSRLLAYWFTDDGVSTLYLANRLTELPLGIFVVSIASVAFPYLSKLSSGRRWDSFWGYYAKVQWVMAIITIPATIALLFLGRSMLIFLFHRGNFSLEDVQVTLPVLYCSFLGIPFHAFSSVAIRAFHAQQNMIKPMRIATVNVLINLILTLILLHFYGATGIAIAGSLSVMLQCIWLQFALDTKHISRGNQSCGRRFIVLMAASLILITFFGVLHFIVAKLIHHCAPWLHILMAIPGAGIYLFALKIMQFPEADLIFEIFHFKKNLSMPNGKDCKILGSQNLKKRS
jgi:putative peptidoglycan lipid II flippase